MDQAPTPQAPPAGAAPAGGAAGSGAPEIVTLKGDDGRDYQVPKALEKNFLLHRDYTQKTQAAAGERRQFEQEYTTRVEQGVAQALMEMAQDNPALLQALGLDRDGKGQGQAGKAQGQGPDLERGLQDARQQIQELQLVNTEARLDRAMRAEMGKFPAFADETVLAVFGDEGIRDLVANEAYYRTGGDLSKAVEIVGKRLADFQAKTVEGYFRSKGQAVPQLRGSGSPPAPAGSGPAKTWKEAEAQAAALLGI